MAYESEELRAILRSLADDILSEPNLRVAADKTGEFRRVTTELSRELLAKVGYRMRDKRWNVKQMGSILGARRETINAHVLDYAKSHGLPVPHGFQRGKVPPDQIVRLPGGKGERQRPRQPRSSR